MEQYMIYIWLAVIVLFTIVESATVNIVTMWFAVGAISAVVINLLGGSINAQLVMFLTVSIVSLILLRPIVVKLLKTNNNIKFNAEAIIGETGKITEDIEIDSVGEVKINGKKWRAKALTNEVIKAGEKVVVTELHGVTLTVKKVEEE